MTSEGGRPLLSREELDALLESAAEGALREEQARRSSRPFAGVGSIPVRPGRLASLQRILDEFAEEQARTLSTLHQITIRFEPLAWEEVSLLEFSSTLLETDLVAAIELSTGGRGYLLVSRSLLIGWMCLAAGARSAGAGGLPVRSYTRIEERFLKRVATELTHQLESRWSPRHDVQAKMVGLEEPCALADRDEGRFFSVSFDVKGMGELCRLRVLLPPSAFDAAEAPPPVSLEDTGSSTLMEPILDMPVELHVEAGSAQLSLSEIGRLRPGDVIALERADAEGLLVRIEDAARFRAERGALGGRLAARILERI